MEAERQHPTLWNNLRHALRGAEGQDFTTGPIGHALLLLAVPMVLEVALESVFAVVNLVWVRKLGPNALAVVGFTEAMLSILYALGMGLGIGATALIARRVGEKRPDEAGRVAVQAIVLGVGLAIPIAIIAGWFAPDFLRLMGADPQVVRDGTAFARIMFIGNGSILLLFLINAIFRGAGDAAVAMRCLWIANAANLVLDPLLIFGIGPFPELGVTGAAVATTVGRGIGVVYQFYRLAGKDRRFEIRRAHLKFDPAVLGTLIRLSASGVFQILISTASWIGVVRVMAGFGANAVAGYTIAIRMVIFGILPAWGLSNAAATMVGQSLGAKDPERAEASVWQAGRFNLYFLGGLGLLFVIAAPWLIPKSAPEVDQIAVTGLRIIAAGFPFYAYGMVLSNALNGAGDTWTPTLINIGLFWLLEIPLAWLLAHPWGMGPTGVFVAIALAFSLLAVVSAAVFRRGRWKFATV